MTTVGFVGLGTMGSRIADRLLEAGHEVHGTNRTKSKAEPLIERGLVWHDTPRDVALATDVVFSMVTNDAALEAITSGEDGIVAGLRTGSVYVDMSTVSPRESIRIAEQVKGAGASMLDAPVSGSVPQAESGTLTIMAGGDQAAFVRAEPVLQQLGESVTRIGENGQGLVLKLAVNISLAVQTLAFSEGLALAERHGVDAELAAKVMSESAIGSPMLKARVPMLLDPPEQAWFDVALMHKDIGLTLAEADGVPLPSTEAADHMLAKAEELGYGERDIAALHEVLKRLANPARAVR